MYQLQEDYQLLSNIRDNAKDRIYEAVKREDDYALASAEHNYALAVLSMQAATLVTIFDGLSKTLATQNHLLHTQNEILRTQNDILHNTRQSLIRHNGHQLHIPVKLAHWHDDTTKRSNTYFNGTRSKIVI